MDIVMMVIYATIVLGLLVFIHEGGHYLAARAFGVRVTEFMLGLPGPHIGFKRGETKFGVTAIPLGGYARVCGMGVGEESPHLARVLRCVYARGTVVMEDVAHELGISEDDAYTALEELVEWGSITGPNKKDKYNTYRTPEALDYNKHAVKAPAEQAKLPVKLEAGWNAEATQGASAAAGIPVAPNPATQAALAHIPAGAEGSPRPLEDVQAFFEAERARTYRSLPFWKRCVILIAGPGMNLLFAMLAFVLIYSVIGYDVQNTETGEITHIIVDPWTSIKAGFSYIGMVFVAILGLFNPQTAAETVSNSTSLVGIAVLSKTAFEQGLVTALSFSAMLSVSLGLMNMLPIPPLDGGRFVVEIYQKIRGKAISPKVLNSLSLAGVALFMLFFIFMVNQDVQRFVFGNWG